MKYLIPIFYIILICSCGKKRTSNNPVQSKVDTKQIETDTHISVFQRDSSYVEFWCSSDILLKTDESIENLDLVTVAEFLSAFDRDCKNNVEFSQWSNELLFDVIARKPDMVIGLLSKNTSLDKDLIISTLEDPIHDGIDLMETIRSVKRSTFKNPIQTEIIEALELALSSSILGIEKVNKKEENILENHGPKEMPIDSVENAPLIFSYDNEVLDLGIGLVIVPPTYRVYNDSLLEDEFVSTDMYDQDITVYAKYSKPDYGIMHFACLEKTEFYFKVIVNYSDIKYMRNSKSYEFQDWEEYMRSSLGVRSVTSQSMRASPNVKAKPVDAPKGHSSFCPEYIQGEWVYVRWGCFDSSEADHYEGIPCKDFINDCDNGQSGWLKWRDKNEVLISIYKHL